MKKAFKWIVITLSSLLLLYIISFIYIFSTTDNFFFAEEKSYTKEDLIENYHQKKAQINELKNYFQKIVPPNKTVEIEFKGDNQIDLFEIVGSNEHLHIRNISTKAKELDTFLIQLGWKRQTLYLLKEKLDSANCISIKSGYPINIGFQISFLGKYSYNLFDSVMSKSIKRNYSDTCTYIIYNDTVVLQYGGGAIGQQCFH